MRQLINDLFVFVVVTFRVRLYFGLTFCSIKTLIAAAVV